MPDEVESFSGRLKLRPVDSVCQIVTANNPLTRFSLTLVGQGAGLLGHAVIRGLVIRLMAHPDRSPSRLRSKLDWALSGGKRPGAIVV